LEQFINSPEIKLQTGGVTAFIPENKAKEIIEQLSNQVYGLSYISAVGGRKILWNAIDGIRDILEEDIDNSTKIIDISDIIKDIQTDFN
jgi:hypothetical protein